MQKLIFSSAYWSHSGAPELQLKFSCAILVRSWETKKKTNGTKIISRQPFWAPSIGKLSPRLLYFTRSGSVLRSTLNWNVILSNVPLFGHLGLGRIETGNKVPVREIVFVAPFRLQQRECVCASALSDCNLNSFIPTPASEVWHLCMDEKPERCAFIRQYWLIRVRAVLRLRTWAHRHSTHSNENSIVYSPSIA